LTRITKRNSLEKNKLMKLIDLGFCGGGEKRSNIPKHAKNEKGSAILTSRKTGEPLGKVKRWGAHRGGCQISSVNLWRSRGEKLKQVWNELL